MKKIIINSSNQEFEEIDSEELIKKNEEEKQSLTEKLTKAANKAKKAEEKLNKQQTEINEPSEFELINQQLNDLRIENQKLIAENNSLKTQIKKLKKGKIRVEEEKFPSPLPSISVKDWKDINPNFTSELIQEWKSRDFTYEQCADWIKVNSPNQQDQAIKEADFYAYLRDIRQVDSEQMLNI